MTGQGIVLRCVSLRPGCPPHRGLADLCSCAQHRRWGKPHSWSWAGAGWGSSGGSQRVPPGPVLAQPLHLHLPHVLVPLPLHAPQLRHALLQVGSSVAVLDLVVLAAVLGWDREGRGALVSKSSRHPAHGSERWAGAEGSTGNASDMEPVSAQRWPQGAHLSMGRDGSPMPGRGPGRGPGRAARLTLMNCMSSLVFFSMCCSRSPWNVCTWGGGQGSGQPYHSQVPASLALPTQTHCPLCS